MTNKNPVELYLDTPILRDIRDRGGASQGSFLITSGLASPVIAYLLPVLRALDHHGYNVTVLCFPQQATWLDAAKVFLDFDYETICDFNKKWDAHALYQPSVWPFTKGTQGAKPKSWFSRMYPGYDFYSRPYIGHTEPHVLREFVKQVEVSRIPRSFMRPLDISQQALSAVLDTSSFISRLSTDLIDTPGYEPDSEQRYFPGFECDVHNQKFGGFVGRTPEDFNTQVVLARFLAADEVRSPLSFPAVLRALSGKKTQILPPIKMQPKWERVTPEGLSTMSIDDILAETV